MAHELIDHPDGHQFHQSVEVKVGLLAPLIKKFLDDAGKHGDVFYDMVKENFDPDVMVKKCGEIAKGHGFWDAHREKALEVLNETDVFDVDADVEIRVHAVDMLVNARLLGDPTIFMALMVTEMAEAIEAYRKDNRVGKDGMWEELADVVVRLFDFIARFGDDDEVTGLSFMSLVAAKMAKNESRPHLHGKEF